MNHLSCTANRLIVALILATLSAGAVADIFVSRDANGRPVYSDREPAGPHQRIRVEERPVSPKAEASTPIDQQAAWQKAAEDREERARKAEQERIAAAEEKARRCAEARRQNATYSVDGRKCSYDADGNRSCLSSAEIDAKRAEARQLMAANCTAGN